MRWLHSLLCRLVRTESHLPLSPLAVPTGRLWPARTLHEFGHPDRFGDLRRPAERLRARDVDGAERSASARPLPSHSDHSGRTGLGVYSRHDRDSFGPDSAGNGKQDDHTAADVQTSGRVAEQDSFAAHETKDGTSAEPTELPVAEEQLVLAERPPTATAGHSGEQLCLKKRSSVPLARHSASVRAAGAAADVLSSASEVAVTSDAAVIDWELEPDDADDVAAEHLRQVVSQVPRLGISAHAYARRFKRMVKNGKLREALELFQNQMLLVDRVQPDGYCYNILISGCAQAGYSRMAFKLYRDMRRRRLKPNHVTYTSLLNACANGPSPESGLRRIQQLTTGMAQRGYKMNVINYQALIKAYGRCGELQRAFETADELLQLGHPLTPELASVLLQACISDSAEGFRHALLVWHKLRWRQVAPSIYLYNLMLRAALDCGAGDTTTFERAMQLIVSGPLPADTAAGEAPLTVTAGTSRGAAAINPAAAASGATGAEQGEAGPDRVPADPVSGDAVSAPVAAGLPDLLGGRPHRGGLLQLKHLDTPPDRLAVLGGWQGVLQSMASDGVRPDVRTFSLLLNAMPNEQMQEERLLSMMDELEVKPDVGFFNQLIKKRASCRNVSGAKAAFTELGRRGLGPDVASFGCLAMTVRSMEEYGEFMDTLKAAEVRPNVEVLTALLNGAVRAANPQRSLAVMEAFVKHQVQPDRRALLRLEELRLRLQTLLVDRERGRPVPPAARRSSFPGWVRTFRLRYAGWLAETEVEPAPPSHQQYRARPLAELVTAADTGTTQPPAVQGPAAGRAGDRS